jgi:AraC-like DNA-binding protein
MEFPFRIREFAPSETLQPYIKRWIYYEYTSEEDYIHKVAPSGTIYLNHAYDCLQPTVVKGDLVIDGYASTLFVGHPIRSDVQVKYHKGVKQVLVEFTYQGFFQLFKIPVHKLNDQEVDVSLHGHVRLAELLEGQSSPDEVRNQIEKYLESLVPEAANASEEVARYIESIYQNVHSTVLEDLKAKNEKDQKRIYRLFRKWTGLSPKQFQRIHQLNHIISLINGEDFESLTELAQKAGYYDQSAFIKHVKHYLNQKPSKLINQKEEVLFQFMGGH